MNMLDITRRRLLQMGGVVIASNMLPSISFAAEKTTDKITKSR
ncbi:hypothetical protein M2263_000993 [Providencia alcalifaciens]|nr:hypothetical protein [Providencia alcalifaciens]